jgi:general secretion pathway protein G
MAGRRNDPSVFFAWEKRRGLPALIARAPAGRAILVLTAAALFFVLRHREQKASQVRATRVQITTARRAVSAWRADHDRACPGSLADLVSTGYLHRVPRDAWGHALRLTCPGRHDAKGFDLSSDGPDGAPGGLDRVE